MIKHSIQFLLALQTSYSTARLETLEFRKRSLCFQISLETE